MTGLTFPPVSEGRYAPGATPPLGSYAGTKGFNPARSVYNLRPSQLRRTAAAMGRVRSGSGDAKVACIGDSTTYGANAAPGTTDWPTQLAVLLGTAGVPRKGDLDIGYNAQITTGTTDPRLATTGTWGALSGVFAYTGSAATLTYTSPVAGTTVTVYTYDATGYTLTIDGGAPVSVTPTGSSPLTTHQVTGLANTTHTVKITWTAGTLIVQAIEVTGAANGVRVFNAGCNGQTSDWHANSGDTTWGTLPTIKAWAPDLVLINIGVNDIASPFTTGQTTPFAANVQKLITQLSPLMDVVLLAHTNCDGRDYTDQFAALYGLADSNDVPLVDLGYSLGTHPQMVAVGTGNGDALHPTPAGYGAMARTIFDALAF